MIKILNKILPDNIGINDYYQVIKQFYSYPKRYYHTLEGHICDCLQTLATTEKAESVELATALIFHDIIFDNVTRSEEIAGNLLRIVGKDEEFIANVQALIQVTDYNTTPETLAQQYMLDIDMTILSADRNKFAEYNDAIRQEYKDVCREVYAFGRRKILKEFLNKESIYYTAQFKQFNDKAKDNLAWAIVQLTI